MEKLKYALAFGADAVYCGVPDFSLRARINRFTPQDLKEGVAHAHKLKKKVYATLNIYAHNRHLPDMKQHILFLKKIGVDAVIASDPGVMMLVQKHWPEAEIHLSTQANATNWPAVKFWQAAGIKRIILARELNLEEIKEIRKKVVGIQLEYFVHGAMCMSYSGRCILSKWMTDRSANLGDCSQPCRWSYKKVPIKKDGVFDKKDEKGIYKKMRVVDDQERFEMEVEEDQKGTYFFNSHDLNLIEHLGLLMEAGVDCVKIEGRAKSAYYLAIVTRAYRKVLDALENKLSKKEREKIIQTQKGELDNLTHRGYSTGFLLGNEPEHNFENRNNPASFQFVGEILAKEGRLNVLRAHNQFFREDILEAVTPEKNIPLKLIRLLDHNKKEVASAHGGHEKKYYLEFDSPLEALSLIRRKRKI